MKSSVRMDTRKRRIGLVVNPLAGLGGRVGLKGSDGEEIQRKALQLGAAPHASDRAAQALKALLPMQIEVELLTWPATMGEEAARQAGLTPRVVGSLQHGPTSADDTRRASREMIKAGVELILFAGGDGTARDIYTAIGMDAPALGIPAGVKIHSAVYATNPRSAGELTVAFLKGDTELRLSEVMDLDEDEFRLGRVSARLFGTLSVPHLQRHVQGAKAPSQMNEPAVLNAIAEDMKSRMKPGWLYIFGPGSTTHAVAARLGLNKTLLGVDAVMDGKGAATDASEADLLRLLSKDQPAEIVVTPIGGQGCLFGRGNQPISPEVIRKVGRMHIHVISTPEKIQALKGLPLWVDTGDPSLDEMLSGYLPVITGHRESLMYRVTS